MARTSAYISRAISPRSRTDQRDRSRLHPPCCWLGDAVDGQTRLCTKAARFSKSHGSVDEPGFPLRTSYASNIEVGKSRPSTSHPSAPNNGRILLDGLIVSITVTLSVRDVPLSVSDGCWRLVGENHYSLRWRAGWTCWKRTSLARRNFF